MDEENKIEEFKSEIKIYKEQLGDFIESAAHDLHAPLRKLSVLVERLVVKHEDIFNSDAKEYIRRIQTCVEEMKSLVDGLTDLATANVEATPFSDCNLTVIAEDTLKIFSEEIEEKNISVHVGHLPVVMGNDFQYRQLFKNLFENAIKFSRRNFPAKVDVESQELTEEEKRLLHLKNQKKYFRIDIEDNGIGFVQDYAEKIFQPFVRLQPRSEFDGSGLGLTICKKIVTNHKGIIYAEGNEKHGSRFVLILPESP